jgi:outer membrane protein, heavy metal efflux system
MVLLRQLLGMEPGESLLLRDTLESLVTRSAAGTPAGAAPAVDRPDVREADARVALADARVDQARREARVDVSLFGAYMRMDAGFPQLGFTMAGEPERVRGQFHSIAAGAVVMMPLFNRNQGEIASALAARAGAEARREAAALAARAEIAAALARDAQAQRAVALYAGGLRALARQNLDVIRQTFELGRATVFDVLAEQRRFLDLEQMYTTTLREAWDARTALVRARGEAR